ncbi:MAG: hypothetical protein ACE14L_16460 [Terriglobales bacterium]
MNQASLRRAGIVLFWLVCVSSAFAGSGPAKEDARHLMASTSPNELVQRVVENELHAQDEGDYMYRDWRQTPAGSKTKEMIETRDGVVARLIAINDKPLTPEQRAVEEARLRELLARPELQKERQKVQQQDAERVKRMFRELPKAFTYQYQGVEQGTWGELIKLSFVPKPNYDAPSRETSVFKAMAGTMWVGVPDLRLARIEATLFRDVNFGWGILGHLDKGGHFFVEQSKIGPERWEATYMNIQFTGKALLFKTINLRQIERLSDFRPVPRGLTLAQGIDILMKQKIQIAETASLPSQ